MLVSEISKRCDWGREEEEVSQPNGGGGGGEEKLSGGGDNWVLLYCYVIKSRTQFEQSTHMKTQLENKKKLLGQRKIETEITDYLENNKVNMGIPEVTES